MALSLFMARMRHQGCGGLLAQAELVTGVADVSGGLVRQIELLGG
jgi:hypothetical protein